MSNKHKLYQIIMKKNKIKIFGFILIYIIPMQIVAQDIKTIISKINQDTSYYPNSVELVEIQNKFDDFFMKLKINNQL